MESQFRNFFFLKFKVKLFKHKIIMNFSDIETQQKKSTKKTYIQIFSLNYMLC